MKNKAICAIATPPGSSALGVIRVSGTNLEYLLKPIFSKKLEDRTAKLVDIYDNKDLLDSSISIYYAAPRSYTGEDMIEIICHGNQIIMSSILSLLNRFGVRHAKPGEFTERAFFNNKLNLIQAEAISDLISSSDKQAIKAAQNSLSGRFVDEINLVCSKILAVRAEVESIINFPEDDDIPDLSLSKIKQKILTILTDLNRLIKNSHEGMLLNNRLTYAVVGQPNSGKSSLINFLLREDASIVTSKKGTTRDSISYELTLNNKIINIIDTAGIHNTDDEIEREGIARSIRSASKADKVLYIVDGSKGLTRKDEELIIKYNIENYTFIFNKIDLTDKNAKIIKTNPQEIYVSVKTGEGMHLIKEAIEGSLKLNNSSENTFLARRRHIEHLDEGQQHLIQSKELINEPSLDVLAEELRMAHLAISSILGQNPTEDLLTEIFTSFCIGK